MKLTKQAEIAVQVLVLCARPPSNAAVTTRMAAEFAGVTKDHAAQVVCRLSRAGYLESTRGRSGGIRLAVAASRITVGEVLRLLEPTLGGRQGAAGKATHARGSLDPMLREAMSSFVLVFDSFTIADLVADPASSRIACLDCDLHAHARRVRMLSRLGGDPTAASLAAATGAPTGTAARAA